MVNLFHDKANLFSNCGRRRLNFAATALFWTSIFCVWSCADALAQTAPAPATVQRRVPAPTMQANQPSTVPIPDSLELAKLVWSTILAVDSANKSGNYSVLRDMAAPGFQQANDAARLSEIFAGLRNSRIDLANVLLLNPTYAAAPHFVEGNLLRVQGTFGLRPTAISFDLHFQWNNGRWQMFGVSINPAQLPTTPQGRN